MVHSFCERNSRSDGGNAAQCEPDALLEHASVEVDTGVPAVEAELPLLVDEVLVGIVVVLQDVVPFVLFEESSACVIHLIEVVVGIIAGFHRGLELGSRFIHLGSGSLLVIFVVCGEGIFKDLIEIIVVLRASNEVVSLIDVLGTGTIEKSSSVLSRVACD